MQQTALIHRIADTVHAIDPQAEVILYGSQARNEAREDSDVDLLIPLDKDWIISFDIEI
jgi:predicted nucleotidyltransferase